jgi:putative transposase
MEAHVKSYGVEPMCRVLQIAPSTWHEHARHKADPALRSTRTKEDERLSKEIARVHAKNFGVYGAKKVWLQLNREGFKVGRDRVARLMARLGLEGVVRGKVVRTTTQDKAAACPFDLVADSDSIRPGIPTRSRPGIPI